LNLALDAIEENPQHIAIIEILSLSKSNITADKIRQLVDENPNLFFDFYEMDDFKELAAETTNRRYMYHFPVHTYMEIRYLLAFPGLSAIVLGEPLNMDLLNAAQLIRSNQERGIEIRVYPAIGRPTIYNDLGGDTGISHFWILPQHIKLYEDAGLIDVIELMDENLARETALCKAYINGNYEMSLKYLFKNMDSEVLGSFVDEEWVKKRQSCNRRCLMAGPRCHKCEREEQMFNMLKDNPHFLERALDKKEEAEREAHAYTNLYESSY
jgi:hypothetical protein